MRVPMWMVRVILGVAVVGGVALLGLLVYDMAANKLPDIIANHQTTALWFAGFAVASIVWSVGMHYLVEFHEADQRRRREG